MAAKPGSVQGTWTILIRDSPLQDGRSDLERADKGSIRAPPVGLTKKAFLRVKMVCSKPNGGSTINEAMSHVIPMGQRSRS